MSARKQGAMMGALVFDVLPAWPASLPAPPQSQDSKNRALAAAEAKRARRVARNRKLAKENAHERAR